MQKTISIIVPIHNEEKNIPLLYAELVHVFQPLSYQYEILFVNDGSTDASQEVMNALAQKDASVRTIEFSRNFGKESATTAGLHYATGDSVIIIDADLQHPPVLIPQFIAQWEAGTDVVIGIRQSNKNIGFIKSAGSFLYYKIINAISDTPILAGSTDFRLIDRTVVDVFNTFTEHERITRGLIDWLGFRRSYITFDANERINGEASYSFLKLLKLGISSSIAHSLFPLKFAGYFGVFIMTISGIGGIVVFIERYIYHDVLNWDISGTAQLAILMIFFIGITLSCLGLIALYIGNIHNEVSGRPLYVVRSVHNIEKQHV